MSTNSGANLTNAEQDWVGSGLDKAMFRQVGQAQCHFDQFRAKPANSGEIAADVARCWPILGANLADSEPIPADARTWLPSQDLLEKCPTKVLGHAKLCCRSEAARECRSSPKGSRSTASATKLWLFHQTGPACRCSQPDIEAKPRCVRPMPNLKRRDLMRSPQPFQNRPRIGLLHRFRSKSTPLIGYIL